MTSREVMSVTVHAVKRDTPRRHRSKDCSEVPDRSAAEPCTGRESHSGTTPPAGHHGSGIAASDPGGPDGTRRSVDDRRAERTPPGSLTAPGAARDERPTPVQRVAGATSRTDPNSTSPTEGCPTEISSAAGLSGVCARVDIPDPQAARPVGRQRKLTFPPCWKQGAPDR